jgi:hypothetical protein
VSRGAGSAAAVALLDRVIDESASHTGSVNGRGQGGAYARLYAWFHHDTADVAFAVLDPTRTQVTVLSTTDTDVDRDVLG